MKYIVRAIKYFFYFAALTTLIVLGLILIGAVEGNIESIFDGGYDALWKMALMFAACAAIYPRFAFITREVTIDSAPSDKEIVDFFRERRYDLEQENGNTMTFRYRGIAGRLSKMYEDRITLSRIGNTYVMEGLRKDILRISIGFENSFGTQA